MGNSRLSFQPPTIDADGVQFCNPREPECVLDFQSPENLPYCLQSDLHYPFGRKFPCMNLTSTQLVEGQGNGGEYFFATRQQKDLSSENVQYTVYPKLCDTRVDNCSKYVYATQPEDFTILIDHGFTSLGLLNQTGTSHTMHGAIMVSDFDLCNEIEAAPQDNIHAEGKRQKPWTETPDGSGHCLVNPNKTARCRRLRSECLDKKEIDVECGYDIIQVKFVLDSMQASLPRLDDPVHQIYNETHRDQGIIIGIDIIYSNVDKNNPFKLPGIPYYTLRFSSRQGENAKWRESSTQLAQIHGAARILNLVDSSAGMKFIVTFIDDDILEFDFATLLSTLTSAITLIFMSSQIVEIYMLSPLSKYRRYYKNLKFQKSIDFSELSEFLKERQESDVTIEPEKLRGSLDSNGLTELLDQRHKNMDDNVTVFRWTTDSNGKRQFSQIEIPSHIVEEADRQTN